MSLAGELSGSFLDRLHPFRVLVVDSNKRAMEHLSSVLGPHAVVERAGTADTALQMLAIHTFDLLVLRLKLPLFSGMELAKKLKRIKPELAVLSLASPSETDERGGIVELGYPPPIAWPNDEGGLHRACRERMQTCDWLRRIGAVREELKRRFGFNDILSMSDGMSDLFEKLVKLKRSRVPVLISGPSGTGKELTARLIHQMSERARKAFLTVNCAAVPEGLLESQFFGHEKGAFTGAVNRSPGKFELANNGTLFLDEIGEMSPPLQAKLLRVIEYNEFERVGGSDTVKVDVRLITATNRNLQAMVASGAFRSDLYYRICVYPVELPPLEGRIDDLNLLAYHFLLHAEMRNNRQIRAISPPTLELLRQYPWPGNVRELENAIERAVLLCDGLSLTPEDFPVQLQWRSEHAEAGDDLLEQDDSLGASNGILPLKALERKAIIKALRISEGNISLAARKLGIGRNTLYRKIEDQGITEEQWVGAS